MRALLAILVATISLVGFCPSAFADDINIVDVRRNIPLAEDEPVFKDFYINAGESAGLKRNMVVVAMRKVSIRDANGSQTYGEIEVPVGQLRLLAVYGRLSVAREYKLLSRDENPMLEQTGLMVGDRIEIKGAFTDSKPVAPPPKKKVSESVKPADESLTTVLLVTPAAEPQAATTAPTPATAQPPATRENVAASSPTAPSAEAQAPAPAAEPHREPATKPAPKELAQAEHSPETMASATKAPATTAAAPADEKSARGAPISTN